MVYLSTLPAGNSRSYPPLTYRFKSTSDTPIAMLKQYGSLSRESSAALCEMVYIGAQTSITRTVSRGLETQSNTIALTDCDDTIE